jgi:predicted patatin/cPLA2 family phospholipase
MVKATMVLEGGAVRGVFTSGVLDYLMEQDLYPSHVIGVSAGSCNAVDYVSKQPGRTRDCMIPRTSENNYMNTIPKFIKEKRIMDMDMIFDKYPYEVFPFDFETYFTSEMKCDIVVTNCETGKAEYLDERSNKERLMKICRASSSMPLVAPIVNVDGKPYLDGGLADSVPIERALEIGNEKIIVIQTKNPGYRKKQTNKATARLYQRAYKKYPNLVKTAIDRNEMYNRQAEIVEKLEAEGKIFVLRPLIPMVSRLERDRDSLLHFYAHGYRQMRKQYQELLDYLEK